MQGNYKTDLTEVSGPIRTIRICSDINQIFLSVNDGVFSWCTRNHCCGKSGSL